MPPFILNESQRACVAHGTGPAAVFAGPGSGKTRVVTMRAARLLELGNRVLVTTFTNDATEEMRERLSAAIPASAVERLTVSTVHSLCMAILVQSGRKIDLLTDESRRRGLADTALTTRLPGGTGEFLRRIGYLKNTGSVAQTYRGEGSPDDREFCAAWLRYETEKQRSGLIEFDDLLIEAARMPTSHPKHWAAWDSKFHYVLVDEAQDMNHPQFQLLFALCRRRHNLMMVGDIDQSLYAFRGADIQTFQKFSAHPATKIYHLSENYRSTRSVITFGQHIIKQAEGRVHNLPRPQRSQGPPVRWLICEDPDHEAAMIAEEVAVHTAKGGRYSDFAVLYRENAQSEALERMLAAFGIPYTAKLSGDFYSRREVAGLLAYLEFLNGFGDDWFMNLFKAPPRKVDMDSVGELKRVAELRGKTMWQHAGDFIAPDRKTHRVIQEIVRDVGDLAGRLKHHKHAGETVKSIRSVMKFDAWLAAVGMNADNTDRMQNLDQLQDAASHYRTIEEYLRAVHRIREEKERRRSEARRKKGTVDAVTLATGHGAKGREWKRVYAIGWNESLLPHSKSTDIEEERRIAYVIATRAEDELTVSSLRTWNGGTVIPSCFLTGTGSSAIMAAPPKPAPTMEDCLSEASTGLFQLGS